jgi:hypothetical protein
MCEDIEITHASQELWVAVQARHRLTPVISRGPILGQRLNVVPVGAVAPVHRFPPVGPARVAHTVEKVLGRRRLAQFPFQESIAFFVSDSGINSFSSNLRPMGSKTLADLTLLG